MIILNGSIHAKHRQQRSQGPFTLWGGAEQNGPGDHWVTINGNHVLIRDSLDLVQRDTLPLPPRPPGIDQSAWDRNIEQTQISPSLGTVHDLGLIVFGETQSYSDRPDSNEPIEMAREKLAHAVINGDEQWGADRQQHASTALPIEPSEKALRNPAVRAAYESSMKAAREAYLSGTDPTNGAVYLNQRGDGGRYNRVVPGGDPRGERLSTQSGPYNNSYTGGKVHSGTAWLNTYYAPDK
jgi:hypothetical protein